MGNPRGRPRVAPGHQSIEVSVTVEVPLFRRYRMLAQHRQEPIGEVFREALRKYIAEKLHKADEGSIVRPR